MSKMQSFIAKDKKIFVGLEDSKKTWKVAVRSEKMLIVHLFFGKISVYMGYP